MVTLRGQLAMVCCGLLSCACSTSRPAFSTHVSPSALIERISSSAEWVTYGHDYGNQRYSPLSEINAENASKLVPTYVVQTGVLGSFETSPVVADGVMYISTPHDAVAAINARTGDVLWRRPPLSGRFKVCCGPANRGVAVTRDLVIIGQLDGVLVALDRGSGDIKWAKAVADNTVGYSMTMAPLIIGDSIIIGVGGREFGIRGWLSSYALRDGTLQWRWNVTDPRHWFGLSRKLLSDSGRFDERESANDERSLPIRGSVEEGGYGPRRLTTRKRIRSM